MLTSLSPAGSEPDGDLPGKMKIHLSSFSLSYLPKRSCVQREGSERPLQTLWPCFSFSLGT